MAELYELSASELVERIARRQASPLEVCRAHLNRIEQLEPRLHAWATLDAAAALATAEGCAQQLAAGSPCGALCGLPLGVKDIYYTAGLRTSAASPLLADFVPRDDAAAVARLRQAGAIVMGKTVTTQFADGDPPPTRNPWNLERTPGGSSSGSAAAVAARMVPAALGSQTAGSVLRPAGYCGVVGLKPTFGRISRRNVLPFAWSLDTMGVIVRSVDDAALLLQVLAGHDPLDDGSASRPLGDYRAAAAQPRAPRLGLLTTYLDRSQPTVREHLQAVATRFAAAGAEVRELAFPLDLDLALAAHHVIMISEAADLHNRTHASQPDAYAPRIRGMIEVGSLLPAMAAVRAQRWRRRLRRAVEALHQQVDVLLLPTASNTAPGPATTGDTTFQAIWTMLGLPAITLPSGRDPDGLPFAIQLVARAWDETGLLSAARWCEQRLDPLPAPL